VKVKLLEYILMPQSIVPV